MDAFREMINNPLKKKKFLLEKKRKKKYFDIFFRFL